MWAEQEETEETTEMKEMEDGMIDVADTGRRASVLPFGSHKPSADFI